MPIHGVCVYEDTVTLKAVLKVVKSLVTTERMLIHTPFLGSALLRIYSLAKVREAGVALEETVDDAAVSLTGMLAETGAECLKCFLMIDPRQFEDAVTDVLSFLHLCTHSQPPFSASVGAAIAAESATQTPSVFVNSQTESDSVLVCLSLCTRPLISLLCCHPCSTVLPHPPGVSVPVSGKSLESHPTAARVVHLPAHTLEGFSSRVVPACSHQSHSFCLPSTRHTSRHLACSHPHFFPL